ncbi:class I SAM-dependent methyltransferase [Candidatus Omnitrophota bacterium]
MARQKVFMDSSDVLRPGGSGILPEETPSKFLARHLSSYHFALPYLKGKHVLEIGFGDGYGANFLAGHVGSIKAVDVLEKNVKLASNKYNAPNLEFRQMSATDLYFDDNSFDVILSFQVIEHIEEEKLVRYLEEIKRVLKKGGLAFISTLNLDKNRKPGKTYNKNPFHVKEFNYDEFSSLIKKVFDDCQIHGLFYSARLRFYERLKKIGFSVDRFYDNIRVDEFIWKDKKLTRCIDFMAGCRKTGR